LIYQINIIIHFLKSIIGSQKSLKIPKGYTEDVNRRTHNVKKNKKTNSDLQSSTQKAKDQATQTPLKT
jgi:hypothetical protein